MALLIPNSVVLPQELHQEIEQYLGESELWAYSQASKFTQQVAKPRITSITNTACDRNNFYKHCQEGKLITVIKCMKSIKLYGSQTLNLTPALYAACEAGHLLTVKFLMANGAFDVALGPYKACLSGNIELTKYMLSKRSKTATPIIKLASQQSAPITRLNTGLSTACEMAHSALMQLMILEGATQCHHCDKSINEH